MSKKKNATCRVDLGSDTVGHILSFRITDNLNKMLYELTKRGEEVSEVFSLIITKTGRIGLHAHGPMTPEYLASIIDILEDSLRQLNTAEFHEIPITKDASA
jgi:hypothetical protein